MNEEWKKDFILLGQRIKKLREEKNLSIKDMALKTGIRVQYLKRIEEGSAYGISIDRHLLKIATTLELPVYKLLKI